MKIIKRGQIEHYHKCEYCGCEMIYEYQDVYWDSTDNSRLDYYYIHCPNCYEKLWLDKTPELDELYQKHVDRLMDAVGADLKNQF